MRTASISKEHKNPCIKFLSDQEFNSASTAKSVSILVVEDDDLLKKVTPLILNFCGYSVTLATTGKEALKLFKKKFDLILLDIRLPDMNGFEVCKEMRLIDQINGSHTPILAYTAFGELVRKKCIEAGMDDLLTKGICMHDLKNSIQKNLRINN